MVVNKSIIKPILNTNGQLVVSFYIPNPDTKPSGKTTNVLSLLILLYDEKFDKLVGEDKYIIPYFSFIAKYIIEEFTNEYREDISKFINLVVNGSINPTSPEIIENQFLDLFDKFKKTFFNKFFWGIDISKISNYENEINQILSYILIFSISNNILSNTNFGYNQNDINRIREVLGRLVGHLIVDVRMDIGGESGNINFINNVYRLVKGGIKDIVRKFFVSYYLRYHYLGNFLGFIDGTINRGAGLNFLEYSILNRFGFSLDTITNINLTDKSTLKQILQTISLAPISLYIEIPLISISSEILSQLVKSKSSTPILQYIKSKLNVDFSKVSFIDLLDIASKYVSQGKFNLKFTGYLIDITFDNYINNIDNISNKDNIGNINSNVGSDVYERYFDFKILDDFLKYLKVGEGLVSNTLDVQDIIYASFNKNKDVNSYNGRNNNYEEITFQPKILEEFYLIDTKKLEIGVNNDNGNDMVKQAINSLLPFAQIFENIKNSIIINQLFKD